MTRDMYVSVRTFGNFAVITALTSATVASGSTSIVKGKPDANAGSLAAVDIVNDTIFKVTRDDGVHLAQALT